MAKKKNKRWSIRTNWMLYAMLIPGIALVVTFNYMPLYGLIIAFQDYNPLHGFLGSPFVGLKWFRYLLDMPDFPIILRNTLSIAGSKILVGTVVSLLFALFLNEVRGIRFKKIVQTVSYMPYFLSWVILGGIFVDILSMNGVVNRLLGGDQYNSFLVQQCLVSIHDRLHRHLAEFRLGIDSVHCGDCLD